MCLRTHYYDFEIGEVISLAFPKSQGSELTVLR